MKILITGATGMLGDDLSDILSHEHETHPFSRNDLNITDRDRTIKTVKSLSPDIVVNCAAYTHVDLAEKERHLAFAVNGTGVQNLALACEDIGIPICHISTDYVFDGTHRTPYTPFDNTHPVNTYGESKLAGEKYIEWIMSRFYIIRTSWLYGRSRNNFVYTMLKLAQERNDIKVIDDQTGSPTWTVTLSRGISALIKSGAYGTYHITDNTDKGISWFTFAREILRQRKSDTAVIPIPTKQYPTAARRPAYSVLDLSLNASVFGFQAPDWATSLGDFLKTVPA